MEIIATWCLLAIRWKYYHLIFVQVVPVVDGMVDLRGRVDQIQLLTASVTGIFTNRSQPQNEK